MYLPLVLCVGEVEVGQVGGELLHGQQGGSGTVGGGLTGGRDGLTLGATRVFFYFYLRREKNLLHVLTLSKEMFYGWLFAPCKEYLNIF